jgi:N-acyl amino acid synthase of PEP-CTERM/exosortase system
MNAEQNIATGQDATDRFSNLAQEFHVYFEVLHAQSLQAREDAYRIRHQVYCEEFGWEPTYSTGLEVDEYDNHASHVLLRSTHEGVPVGSLRLIHGVNAGSTAMLPMERACGKLVNEFGVDFGDVDRSSIAEVSRLAIAADYRRRRSDEALGVSALPTDVPHPQHDRFPFLTMGLYLGGLVVARREGYKNLFMLLETRLSRHLNAIGFKNKPLGEAIDHHGLRMPALLNVENTIASLRPSVRHLFEGIARDIDGPKLH